MKKLFTVFISIISAFFLGWNPAYADSLACQSLLKNAPQGVDIKTASLLPDDIVKTPYCLVKGVMGQRLTSGGEFYSIKFEIRLPDFWTGRFAYQFNDGNDGFVLPAIGSSTGLLPAQFAINQGFAVVSSDGGHDARTNSSKGLNAESWFGTDPQARRDYAYGAVRKLYPVARYLVETYYKTPVQFSYGIGSSNGGRMAMVSATRFPTMFDGLLVGYPAINLPKAALQHAWDIQALNKVDKDLSKALTKRDMGLFVKGILDQCDALDGMNDDLVFAIDACQQVFQPTALVCKGGYDRYCLTNEKVGALVTMFKGPHDSKNQALYSGWDYDVGMRSENWRKWKIESDVEKWNKKPIILAMGAPSLANVFMTPPVKIGNDIFSAEKYLLDFNFDKDAPKIFATNNKFTESSMDLMTPLGVDKPTLLDFKKHGGKMIIFHGNSDPVFSVKDTAYWYNSLDFLHAGKAKEFVRFYRIPGMPHGQGGPSTDRFNMLQPLINWVESGLPPQGIVAKSRLSNPEITQRMVGIGRPLCPYPAYARYVQGDVRQASSFECR